MRVLVTGAFGLIGSNSSRLLRESGLSVFTSDLEPSLALHQTGLDGFDRAIRRSIVESMCETTDFASADLSISGPISALMRRVQPDVVVHAGAVSRPIAVLADPEYAYRVNVSSVSEIGQCARELGAGVVFLSSSQVYGSVRTCVSEDDPLQPSSPYAELKVSAERALQRANADGVALRCSGVYGLGDVGRRMMHMAGRCVLGRGTLQVSPGSVRTVTHVHDVSRAIVSAVSQDWTGVQPVNIGGPERMSHDDLRAIVDSMNPNACVEEVPDVNRHNVEGRVLIDGARRTLGFEPLIGPREGLREVVGQMAGAEPWLAVGGKA